MRASFLTRGHNSKNNIVFLEDCSNHSGGMSITNDAENVVDYCRSIFGNRVRIVYLDTDNTWWEIIGIKDYTAHNHPTQALFKPWYGLAWDLLSKV